MNWFTMLFTIRGSSLRDSWPRIAVATTIAVVVTVLEKKFGIEQYTLTTTPFMLVGAALGIFLGFRNNTAYDRFWEARTLWGSLVNVSRSFARQSISLIDASTTDGSFAEAELHRVLVTRVIAFVHALRHHLRGSEPESDLQRVLGDEAGPFLRQRHVPLAILHDLTLRLAANWREGRLSTLHLPVLEASITDMTNVLGACERIKNTPIPFTFTVLLHRIVAFYCFFLPFGIVDTVGGFTPVVVFLISHAFFGLDVIGEEIEEPFSMRPHALPLTALTTTIEANLLELLGEKDLPDVPKPVDGVLL